MGTPPRTARSPPVSGAWRPRARPQRPPGRAARSTFRTAPSCSELTHTQGGAPDSSGVPTVLADTVAAVAAVREARSRGHHVQMVWIVGDRRSRTDPGGPDRLRSQEEPGRQPGTGRSAARAGRHPGRRAARHPGPGRPGRGTGRPRPPRGRACGGARLRRPCRGRDQEQAAQEDRDPGRGTVSIPMSTHRAKDYSPEVVAPAGPVPMSPTDGTVADRRGARTPHPAPEPRGTRRSVQDVGRHESGPRSHPHAAGAAVPWPAQPDPVALDRMVPGPATCRAARPIT